MHLAIIRLNNSDPAHHCQVFDALRQSGIGVQLHYLPVHLHPYYRKLGYRKGDFPEAEAYSTNAFSLPLYPGLMDDDVRRVVDTLARQLNS